jgi:uncharacterized membrane protein YqaE (UPF0057 family)
MLKLLAIACPPLAVLATGSMSLAVKNLGLTLLFYVPGLIHARSIVEKHDIEQRYNSVMAALERRRHLQPA